MAKDLSCRLNGRGEEFTLKNIASSFEKSVNMKGHTYTIKVADVNNLSHLEDYMIVSDGKHTMTYFLDCQLLAKD